MTRTARRRAVMGVLALSLFGGGAALTANSSLLSPSADGGLPGQLPGLPGPTRVTITRVTITLPPPETIVQPIDLTR